MNYPNYMIKHFRMNIGGQNIEYSVDQCQLSICAVKHSETVCVFKRNTAANDGNTCFEA